MGSNTKIIGLIGAAGVGKTTLANHLGTFGWRRASFGKGIKDMLTGYLKGRIQDTYIDQIVVGEWKDRPLDIFGGMTSRDMQIIIGQAIRQGKSDFWVQDFIREVQQHKHYTNIIVDDIRQLNEAQAIVSQGGRLVEVVAPGVEHKLYDLAYVGDDIRNAGMVMPKFVNAHEQSLLSGMQLMNFKYFLEEL